MAVGVVAAIVLFLHALEGFSVQARAGGGDWLRTWMARATAHRFTGFALGALATAVVQSSSAVTSLAVALVNAGTLGFRGSLAVLAGANVGTTATAWLVGLKLTGIGPWAIAAGALLGAIPVDRLRWFGKPLFYFGFIFFSLDLISGALEPMQRSAWWQTTLQAAESGLAAVLLGLVMTGLVQSSSVTIGVAVLLVQQGLMSEFVAIGVVVGSNVGSTTTALLASVRMEPVARRAAMANLVFNLAGMLAVLPVLGPYARLASALGSTPALSVAWAHLLFNAAMAIVVLALLSPRLAGGWIGRRWPDSAGPLPRAPR